MIRNLHAGLTVTSKYGSKYTLVRTLANELRLLDKSTWTVLDTEVRPEEWTVVHKKGQDNKTIQDSETPTLFD